MVFPWGNEIEPVQVKSLVSMMTLLTPCCSMAVETDELPPSCAALCSSAAQGFGLLIVVADRIDSAAMEPPQMIQCHGLGVPYLRLREFSGAGDDGSCSGGIGWTGGEPCERTCHGYNRHKKDHCLDYGFSTCPLVSIASIHSKPPLLLIPCCKRHHYIAAIWTGQSGRKGKGLKENALIIPGR